MDCMFEAYLTHEGLLDPDDLPDTKEPIYILGKEYNGSEEREKIKEDIMSRIWCTYRKGFVPIGGGDGLTSDKGWGCMLRCGQMVLAQALLIVHLGRDWVWDPDTMDSTYLKIVRKFEDRRHAPYSIHQIAVTGQGEGKTIGEWFGPNTIAQVLKKLVVYDEWQSLVIHVALDNQLIIDDVKALCSPQGSNKWKPLLLIVPVRLGVSNVNDIYIGSLKKSFSYKQSLGVIGGKPNLALFFLGTIGDELIYLDPHTCQKSGVIGEKETEEEKETDKSYHCKYFQRMNIHQVDPSLALNYLCLTENDFNDLCEQLKAEANDSSSPPLFYVNKEAPQWSSSVDPLFSDDMLGAAGIGESLTTIVPSELEDFELL